MGTVTMHRVPTPGRILGIVTGPDGNLWFTNQDANYVGRFTLSGSFKKFPIPTPQSIPRGITVGPDGNIWFTEFNANKIGKMTLGGKFTEYPVPTPSANVGRFITRMGNKIWFSELNTTQIADSTTNGSVREFNISDQPGAVLAGTGNLIWFDLQNVGAIASMSLQNKQITTYPIPTSNGDPLGMTFDLQGNIWFAEYNANKIGVFSP